MPANRSLIRSMHLCLMAAIVGSYLWTAGAWAQTTVTLASVPDSAGLEPGIELQDIVVTASATAPARFLEAKLQPLAPPTLSAEITEIPVLPGSGDIAWTVRLAPKDGIAAASTVTFRLDYRLALEENKETSGSTALTVKVTYKPFSLAESVAVTLQKGFATLEPAKPGPAILSVTNSGQAAVTIDAVDLAAPEFITIKPETAGALPVTVPAHGSTEVPLLLTPVERIPLGETPLLVRVKLTPAGAGNQTAFLIVSDKVTAGIPGLSDITTVLQIPSFLFLPGLLLVLTWNLAWRIVGRGTTFALPATDGAFYFAVLTGSLAIAYGYSRFLGVAFDFLSRIAVADIAILWVWSIIIGIVLFILVWFGDWLVAQSRAMKASEEERRKHEEWLRANPQPNDGPLAILGKLAAAGLGLNREAFTLSRDGQHQPVFKLGFGEVAPDAAGDPAWVVPEITIDAAAEPTAKQTIDRFIDAGDANGLVACLDEAGAGVALAWATGNIVSGPTIVDRSALDGPHGSQPIAERQ